MRRDQIYRPTRSFTSSLLASISKTYPSASLLKAVRTMSLLLC
jgi:hypothetical protein